MSTILSSFEPLFYFVKWDFSMSFTLRDDHEVIWRYEVVKSNYGTIFYDQSWSTFCYLSLLICISSYFYWSSTNSSSMPNSVLWISFWVRSKLGTVIIGTIFILLLELFSNYFDSDCEKYAVSLYTFSFSVIWFSLVPELILP